MPTLSVFILITVELAAALGAVVPGELPAFQRGLHVPNGTSTICRNDNRELQRCRLARTGGRRQRVVCVHSSGNRAGRLAAGGQGPVGQPRDRGGEQRGAGPDRGALPAG